MEILDFEKHIKNIERGEQRIARQLEIDGSMVVAEVVRKAEAQLGLGEVGTLKQRLNAVAVQAGVIGAVNP